MRWSKKEGSRRAHSFLSRLKKDGGKRTHSDGAASFSPLGRGRADAGNPLRGGGGRPKKTGGRGSPRYLFSKRAGEGESPQTGKVDEVKGIGGGKGRDCLGRRGRSAKVAKAIGRRSRS